MDQWTPPLTTEEWLDLLIPDFLKKSYNPDGEE